VRDIRPNPERPRDATSKVMNERRSALFLGGAKFCHARKSGPGRKTGPAPSRPSGRTLRRYLELFELELLDELDELLELEFDELFELELLDEFDELLDDELPARMIWPATPVTWPPFSTAARGMAAAGTPWAPIAAARAAAVNMVSFFMSLSFQASLLGRPTWPPMYSTGGARHYSRAQGVT
jgi:hypothetical protein